MSKAPSSITSSNTLSKSLLACSFNEDIDEVNSSITPTLVPSIFDNTSAFFSSILTIASSLALCILLTSNKELLAIPSLASSPLLFISTILVSVVSSIRDIDLTFLSSILVNPSSTLVSTDDILFRASSTKSDTTCPSLDISSTISVPFSSI